VLFVRPMPFFDDLDENMLRQVTTNSAGLYRCTKELCTEIRPPTRGFSPILKVSTHILTCNQCESALKIKCMVFVDAGTSSTKKYLRRFSSMSRWGRFSFADSVMDGEMPERRSIRCGTVETLKWEARE
jgi:hypothetical protein